MNSINWPALNVWVFIAQAGRALQRERRGYCLNSIHCDGHIFIPLLFLFKLLCFPVGVIHPAMLFAYGIAYCEIAQS